MPKQPKKTPAIQTRHISDFFTRKPPAAPVPSAPKPTAKLSSQSENANPTEPFASPIAKVASFSSSYVSSATRSSFTVSDVSSPVTPYTQAFLNAVEIASPAVSATKSQHLMPPTMPSVKHVNSPRMGSASPRPLPARQRKPIFDSDSDIETPASAIYVSRSPRALVTASPVSIAIPLRATENLSRDSQPKTNPKKKQRFSSPDQCGELVPTSQSDEFELSSNHSPHWRPGEVRQSVNEWRHNTIHASSDDPFADLPAFSFESTSPPADILPSIAPIPASPALLDPSTKTAQIIAEITAKAYAEVARNSHEFPIREFKEDLSESSDDDMLPESPIKNKTKSGFDAQQPLASASVLKRYSLRKRRVSPSPTALKYHSTSATPSKQPQVSRISLSIPKQKGKEDTHNPLDDLLKEKKKDDQRGNGTDATRQAEEAVANRDVIMASSGDEDFTDEAAARNAVLERRQMVFKSSSSFAYNANGSDGELDDSARERLMGEKEAKAIGKLLNSDKVTKQREMEKPAGITLWQLDRETDNFREVDEGASPQFHVSNITPNISMFQAAVKRKEFSNAALLLNTGVVFANHTLSDPDIILYFCELALTTNEIMLSTSIIRALSHIWRVHSVPGISFTCVLATLIRLGARTTIMSDMGWRIPQTTPGHVPAFKFDSVLYRLVALVATSAQHRRLSPEEIPDIIMSLILIAAEPSSSSDLRLEITLAINETCSSIASGCGIDPILESTICTRVLKYLLIVEPINKAYITSLFSSGTGRTKRIARWIAHAIITNQQIVTPRQYHNLPSLVPLLKELTRDSNGQRGKFEQHEDTNFVDMLFYTQILAVAMTNIVGYVMEDLPPTMDAKESDSYLGSIRLAIESLHSGISDIRATHLDRSRAKAALKELSLRIHYQRKAALKSAGTLHNYFPKLKPAKATGS